MTRHLMPLALGLLLVGGFAGCGGSSADATQLAADRDARKKELEDLQEKQRNGTITESEQARLDQINAELEHEGENPGEAG